MEKMAEIIIAITNYGMSFSMHHLTDEHHFIIRNDSGWCRSDFRVDGYGKTEEEAVSIAYGKARKIKPDLPNV